MHTIRSYWKSRKQTFSRVNRKEAWISNAIVFATNLFAIFIFTSPVPALFEKPFSNVNALIYMSIVVLISSFLCITYLASFAKMVSHDSAGISRNYYFKLNFISFQNRISLPLYLLGYKIDTLNTRFESKVFGVLKVRSVKTGLVEKRLSIRINDPYYSPHRDDFEAELGFVLDHNIINIHATPRDHHPITMRKSFTFVGSKPFSKERFKLNILAFKFLMLKIFLMSNLDGFSILWLDNCSAKSIIAASRLKLEAETLRKYIKYNIDIENYDDLRDMPEIYLERIDSNRKSVPVSV